MGGNHSHEFDQGLFHSQWQRKEGFALDGRTVWKNKANPSREIQQFPIYADTEDDIETERQLFALRKDSNELVAATHLKETVKAGLCSSSAQGRLFLERIPLKLQALQHIPFPDVLHLHFNALNGYKRLNNEVGPFRPQNEQIGFNNLGEAKVWLNSDFSASNPSSKEISEVAMVRNLLQLIEDVTDNNTTPRENPSILNYVYRNKNDVTFDEALSAIKSYANTYNGGLIPKNLQCVQRVGVDNISNTLIGNKQESFNSNNLQSQRSGFANTITAQQPFIINHGSSSQRNPIGSSTVVTNYPANQVGQVATSVVQPVVFPARPVQNVQVNQAFQPLPSQFVQQPQVNQSQVPLGASGIRGSRVNFTQAPLTVVQQPAQVEHRFLQSQVQTVRPLQANFVKQREPQRVIEQIVRTPQGSVQVFQKTQGMQVQPPISEPLVFKAPEISKCPPMLPPVVYQTQPQFVYFANNQNQATAQVQQQNGSQFNQNQTSQATAQNQSQVIHSQQINVPLTSMAETVYVQPNTNQAYIAPQVQEQSPVVNQQLAVQTQPTQQTYSPVQNDVFYQTQTVFVNPKSFESQSISSFQDPTSNTQQFNQFGQQIGRSTEMIESEFSQRGRNVIDSNTISIGIDKTATQEYQSYNSSADKFGSGLNFQPSSSRYKDVNLDDGKSSESLLAQLKGFSSSRKDISYSNNPYDFPSSSYNFKSTTNNQTPLYQASSTDQNTDIYSTFNKYAKGANLEDNLEMKYSMTKNLYKQPQTTSYQFESVRQTAGFDNNNYEYSQEIENYQQEGEYQVDYDPEILADIQRLKG